MNKNTPQRRNSAVALSLALALVVAAIVLTRLPGMPWVPDTPKEQAQVSIEKDGLIYAGIPARIEFRTAAGEAALMKLKNVTADEITPGSLSDGQKLDGAWDVLVRTGIVFNAFSPESELGRLNADPTTAPLEVSDWMAEVAGMATTVSQMTKGAFDSTVRPLKTIWAQAAKTGESPSDADVTHALGRMGWGYINLLRTQDEKWQLAWTRPGMELDFGGIVKGWSVGKALNFLKDHGVKSALVQVGGEIALLGDNPSGRPWRIGIRHPVKKDENWTVLTISGRTAVSTSGNYEQPVMVGGIEYYHIFDPVTGRPVPTSVLGTTVVVTGGDNPNALADGLATAFSVMGPDAAFESAAEMAGVEVLFIIREASTGKLIERTTPGFATYRP